MQFHHLALILACCLAPATGHAGAELLGSFVWERPEPYFGGLSGIELSADGASFFVIGDSAIVLTGSLRREAGRIVEVTSDPPWIGGLSMPRGERVGLGFHDSEGLAIAPDGRVFVSFERVPRVWAYADRDARSEPLPELPRDLHFILNSGLEALALAPDDSLWTVPEQPPFGWETLPVLRLSGDHWTVADTLPRDRVFQPVGADFDDLGRLWLLERGLGVLGFRTRVRVFTPNEEGLGEARTVIETSAGTHDNLEGLSVWRDAAGSLILTMISDDNYNRFQVTEIVEYRVEQ